MVKIRNIEIKDNILKFDYYPENKNEKGHAEYDLNKEETIMLQKSPTYECYSNTYFHFALMRIKKAIENKEDLSGTLTCMWY